MYLRISITLHRNLIRVFSGNTQQIFGGIHRAKMQISSLVPSRYWQWRSQGGHGGHAPPPEIRKRKRKLPRKCIKIVEIFACGAYRQRSHSRFFVPKT